MAFKQRWYKRFWIVHYHIHPRTGALTMTDWQAAFDGAVALVFTGIGWFLATLYRDMRSLEQNLTDLVQELPNTYARRDDLKDLISEVRATLRRIEDKLDGKQDK